MESIQSETHTLTKQLKNAETKVSSSSEDLREQYLSTIQVRQSRQHPLQEDLLTFIQPAVLFSDFSGSLTDRDGFVIFFYGGVFSGEPAGL